MNYWLAPKPVKPYHRNVSVLYIASRLMLDHIRHSTFDSTQVKIRASFVSTFIQFHSTFIRIEWGWYSIQFDCREHYHRCHSIATFCCPFLFRRPRRYLISKANSSIPKYYGVPLSSETIDNRSWQPTLGAFTGTWGQMKLSLETYSSSWPCEPSRWLFLHACALLTRSHPQSCCDFSPYSRKIVLSFPVTLLLSLYFGSRSELAIRQ